MKKLIFITFLITVLFFGCGKEPQNKSANILESVKMNNTETEKSSNNSKSANIEKAPKSNVTAENIVLFHGITLNPEDRDIDIYESADPLQKQKMIKKYEQEYSIYSNGKFLGKAIGKTEGRGLDYYWDVSFDTEYGYEMALFGINNPYPREIKNIEPGIPIEFKENERVSNELNSRFNVQSRISELTIVDLDGNGTNEYIALFVDKKNYFFTKCLIDSSFNIISYLTVLKEKENELVDWENFFKYYNLQNSGEIIDINNDGIMEIILDNPIYEGFDFKVFTYKDGKLDGEFINMASIQP